MPYKTPLRKPKVRETVFAHAVKLCWFYVKFEDINNKISLKKFCEEFEKIVIDGGVWEKIISEYNIDCDLYKKDGTIHKPNYKKLFSRKGWINLYEWNTLYPVYKSDMLQSVEVTEREKYIRNMRKLNQKDYDLLDVCYDKEDEYVSTEDDGGKDMTYYRNKNNDTISNIDERLRRRNGFDKTKVELDGNLKTDVKADVKTEVSSEVKLKKMQELAGRMEKMNYD